MIRKVIHTLLLTSTVFTVVPSSKAVFVFEQPESDTHDYYSQQGLEAVCCVEIEHENGTGIGTATLVHPSFVLASRHVVRREVVTAAGFLYEEIFWDPEEVKIKFGEKVFPVAEIIEDMDEYLGEEIEVLADRYSGFLLEMSQRIKSIMGGEGKSTDKIVALNVALSQLNGARDYILLKLAQPVTDIKPMQMKAMSFEGNKPVTERLTMCGYGSGAIYQGQKNEPSDEDVLYLFSGDHRFIRSTEECNVTPIRFDPEFSSGELLLSVTSRKQGVALGDSGGPLVNEEGCVVGVVEACFPEAAPEAEAYHGFLMDYEALKSEARDNAPEGASLSVEEARKLYMEKVFPALDKMRSNIEAGAAIKFQFAGMTEPQLQKMQEIFRRHEEEENSGVTSNS